MRTSVEISDSLFADVRRAVAEQGTTVRALIEEGLRLVLRERSAQRQRSLPNAVFKGEPGLAMGVTPSDLPRLLQEVVHDAPEHR